MPKTARFLLHLKEQFCGNSVIYIYRSRQLLKNKFSGAIVTVVFLNNAAQDCLENLALITYRNK